jgi:hypothetical protein
MNPCAPPHDCVTSAVGYGEWCSHVPTAIRSAIWRYPPRGSATGFCLFRHCFDIKRVPFNIITCPASSYRRTNTASFTCVHLLCTVHNTRGAQLTEGLQTHTCSCHSHAPRIYLLLALRTSDPPLAPGGDTLPLFQAISNTISDSELPLLTYCQSWSSGLWSLPWRWKRYFRPKRDNHLPHTARRNPEDDAWLPNCGDNFKALGCPRLPPPPLWRTDTSRAQWTVRGTTGRGLSLQQASCSDLLHD